MTGTESAVTTTDIARRASGAAAPQKGAALAIRAGQAMWDERQIAALVAMGVPASASKAELATFLHQCQRSGLDPFSRQIYLIYRNTYENGRTISKPTAQTGIDGYRLIRDRIAKRDGLRVEYDDTVWYTADGQALSVWLWDEPPAACTVAIRIDGRRYSSTLRFNEYCQRKKDGALNKMWSEKPAHMIEKCAEADVLRRAFPQDMSGLILEDAAPPGDPDAPKAAQRATAAQIREQRRQPQQVTAEVVENPFNGQPEAQRSPKASPGQVGAIVGRFEHLGYTPGDRPARLRATARLAGHDGELESTSDLTADEAASVLRQLQNVSDAAALDALLNDGEVPGGE